MLVIRLQRIGKKHQPSYRLVVAERRSKLTAPPTEDLGAYNPFTKQASFKTERVQYWLGIGAQPTVTTHNLLVKNGIVNAPKRKVYMKKAEVKAPAEAAAPAAEAPKAEAPAAEAAVEERPPKEAAPEQAAAEAPTAAPAEAAA